MKKSLNTQDHCLSIVFGLKEDISNAMQPAFISINSSEYEMIQQFTLQNREYSCIDFIQQFPNIYSRTWRVAMPLILRPMVIDGLQNTSVPANVFIEADKSSGEFCFEYSEYDGLEEDEIMAINREESIDEYEEWVNWEVDRLECAEEEHELPSLIQRYLPYFDLDNIEEDFYFEIVAIE